MARSSRVLLVTGWICGTALLLGGGLTMAQNPTPAPPLFATSDQCLACHNALTGPEGEDLSIGADWQGSMMAHSAKDPYWQAAVRREVMDHPTAAAAIENECSTCHLPMAHTQTHAQGQMAAIFAHLAAPAAPENRAALDGVSCTLCHQIQPDGLGEKASFVGGFTIDTQRPPEERQIFGPYAVDLGRTTLMRSASGFVPTQAEHLATSEMCATCHTLITHTLNAAGETIGELPEQVPYLEWLHSDYAEAQPCQSCHMPEVEGAAPISSVLGDPRPNVSRHVFRGGNFFLTRILDRFRGQLGVTASSAALQRTASRTLEHLRHDAARLQVGEPVLEGGRLHVDITVENLAGHKLPTAYPSRRAWLHVTVLDGDGTTVFESGAFQPDGSIQGNDNDSDASRYEPHYREITHPDQVQIYEAILFDPQGAVTTGLLTALRYGKDNRLLPGGFDKATAAAEVAVHGEARNDATFTAGGDRIRYTVQVDGASGPFTVQAELLYQPVGYRWAHNLATVDAPEPRRFVGYFEALADASATVLAQGESSGGEGIAAR